MRKSWRWLRTRPQTIGVEFIAEEGTLASETPSDVYRPTLRPRNITMPVDPIARGDEARYPRSQVHDSAMHVARLKAAARLQGSVKLGTVSADRTVGDAYRFCAAQVRGLSSSWSSTGNANPTTPRGVPHSIRSRQSVHSERLTAYDLAVAVNEPQSVMTLLDSQDFLRASLSSPAHGGLAGIGAALANRVVAHDAVAQFPRLRSPHLAKIQHLTLGLLPCCRVAQEIGLVEACGLQTDVGLWRELNFLVLHRNWAQRQLRDAEQRAAAGSPSHRVRYFSKHSRAATFVLRSLPANRSQLQPRIEWLRAHLHAFVGFLHVTVSQAAAESFVREFVCPELSFGTPAVGAFPKAHPLNEIAAMRALAAGSSSGSAATLYTDVELKEELARFPDVPSVVVRAVQPPNALREAQLILAYEPSVPEEWRDAPINFEPDVTTAELFDNADDLATAEGMQTTRDRKRLLRMRMVIGRGKKVVGIGLGRSEREAMQAAAKHMVHGFFFRRFSQEQATA